MKNSLRLARQGLTQTMLLARLLGSGLGLAAVQPVLPVLLGSTLAAAQAQESTQELEKVVILELGQTTEPDEQGQASLKLQIRLAMVPNAETYELQFRQKLVGELAEGQDWRGPNPLPPMSLNSHEKTLLLISLPGVYEARVRALPEEGSSYQFGPWSETREFRVGPEPVTDLQVTPGNKSLNVSWTEPSYAPNGYRVRWRERGADKSWLGDETVTGTSLNIPDLTNLTSYVVRVETRNQADTGVQADTAVTRTGTPSLVANQAPIVANRIPDQRTTVGTPFTYTFEDDTFSDADKNTLTYSATMSDDMALPSWLDFDESTRVFSGTPMSTDTGTLMVKVTAADGTDSVSDTFNIVVGAPPTITDIDDRSVTFGQTLNVDVDATDEDAGDTLQFKAASSDETVATVTPTTLTDHGDNSQITVTPVGAGTATITVTVSDGMPDASETFMVTVSPATLATPVVRLDVGDEQLMPSWVDNNAVPNLASYELQWKRSSITSWSSATGVTTVDLDSATRDTVIPGFPEVNPLTNGQAYDVRVRAKAAAGSTTHQDSAWSESVTGTPAAQTLSYDYAGVSAPPLTVGMEITRLMPNPSGFTGNITYAVTDGTLPPGLELEEDGDIIGAPTMANPNEVTVAVTATAGSETATTTITFPRVNPRPSPINLTVNTVSVGENASPTTITVTAMVEGTVFPEAQTVTVMVGQSGDSATEGTDYTAVDDFTITIDAGENSGSAMFTLTPSDDDNDEDDETIILSGTASSGAIINPVTLTITIMDNDGMPAAPTMVMLEAEYGQLTVSWDMSTDNGGSPITDYDVRYRPTMPADRMWKELPDSTDSTATTATIMELMNGTEYEVQVRAENTNGPGEWSAPAMATAMGVPRAPAMPMLKVGDRQLTVSWNAPDDGGSAITGYDVRYRPTMPADRMWQSLPDSTDSTATTATIMELMNGTEYEVQVRAENMNGRGDWSASAMETPALTKEKLDEVNEEVLPSVLNQVTEKQIAIITDRFATISSDSHMGSLSMEEVVTDVADYLFSHHQDIRANGFDWRQALSGNSFSFALAGASVSQGSMDDGELSPSSFGPVYFWGGIDYSSLEDIIQGFDLYGDTISFNFGVDKEFTPDLVAGVLLSITNSEFELTKDSTDNTYEVDISTVNPYISWEASDDLSLWASVGYGRGQTDLKDDSTNPPVSQSGNFTRFSAGGRFQIWQSEAGTALALKLDGTTAHFLDVDAQNSRLATEISHGFSIESGVLNTSLELGLLMSSADESAAELASRLHWQGDEGFSASAQSRVLLGGGDRQEWGIGGSLHYTTGGDGEGLMMSLEPSFGISNPQLLPGLWSATRFGDPAVTTEAPTARLDAKLAYGFPTSDGLLTPYTDFSFSETTSTYGTGLRYGLPTGLDLDLKGMRKTSTTDAAENTILLELRSDL